MTDTGPRRLAINDRGLWLGIDAAGTWLICSDDHAAVHATDRLVWLLPLLEQTPDDVVAALGTKPEDTPLPALVQFALTGASEYWRGRALAWLESTWPTSGVLDVLADLKDDLGPPQPTRHRALRL